MKKLLYILALSITTWSCGGGGGDTPPPTPVNTAPKVPTLVYPTNNLLCINNVLDFNWEASFDPDEDVITYQVQVAKDAQFTLLEQDVTVSSTLTTLSLEIGTPYYWRAKAFDGKAWSNYSAVNQFYTEGNGISNHLPFTPELVAPDLNSVETGAPKTLNLQWTASDVDTTDTLTYDVYFGTETTPSSLMGDNQSTNNLNVAIIASTTYYWNVVVKDGKGGQTIGQIWNFTTD